MAAPDVPALAGLFVDTAEAQGGGFVLQGGEPQLELPLHGLGVRLVRREDGFVRDSALGPVPHRLEVLLREPQTGALERDIRVGHGRNATEARPPGSAIFRHLPGLCLHDL